MTSQLRIRNRICSVSITLVASSLVVLTAGCGNTTAPSESFSLRDEGTTADPVSFVSVVVKDLKYTPGQPGGQASRICFAVFAGPEGFPNDGSKVVVNGCKDVDSTIVSFLVEGLPPSTNGYGLSLFQDLNGNNKLDTRTIFGVQIPDEPFGFTNNPAGLRQPTYEEVRINPVKNGDTFTINMRSL